MHRAKVDRYLDTGRYFPLAMPPGSHLLVVHFLRRVDQVTIFHHELAYSVHLQLPLILCITKVKSEKMDVPKAQTPRREAGDNPRESHQSSPADEALAVMELEFIVEGARKRVAQARDHYEAIRAGVPA